MSHLFERAGKTEGLQVWRVEDFSLASLQKSHHGNFFSGDCYLILNSKKSGNSLTYDLHYWIGEESSQDEQGSVAAFATQLDDYLRGLPTQYREVQNYESKRFKSHFPGGLIYKAGGVKSGFHHVETNKSTVRRLLHVKGKKTSHRQGGAAQLELVQRRRRFYHRHWSRTDPMERSEIKPARKNERWPIGTIDP